MRWSDLYLGLMAATMGFAASVSWVAGMPWQASVSALGLAGVFLIIMVGHASRVPRLLLVGRHRHEPLYDVAGAIDDAGYALVTCPGPDQRPCPALRGGVCPYRGSSRGVVIYRHAGDERSVPPCERALGVPAVCVEEGEMPTRAIDRLADRGVLSVH